VVITGRTISAHNRKKTKSGGEEGDLPADEGEAEEKTVRKKGRGRGKRRGEYKGGNNRYGELAD